MPVNEVSRSRFPVSLFIVLFLILLLMSGVHVGLIVLMNRLNLSGLTQTVVTIVYWAAVALGLTVYTGRRMKRTFETPMLMLADATRKVAGGDFSVYVAPYHTADSYDYLDVMLLDFNKMVEELGSIETLKTDFFSNVSHEFRTPLAAIQNYAELLCQKNLPEEKRVEYAASIGQSSKRLSSLITNLLKLGKLEKQTIRPKPEPYDLCRQLCDCALGFESEWERKELEFLPELEDSVFITADESLMEIVWNNLLGNAVKFTDEGGAVTLSETSDDERVAVTISDTGCGMSDETIKHIFDKFYQGDTSHSTEGNGLGLALTLRILELSGFSVTVNSAVGEGSAFTVTIPLGKGRSAG